MTGRPGVLFDVDGTLVDSNYLHTVAWSRALRDRRLWAPMHAIHRLIGMGGDELVGQLLEADPATVDELTQGWKQHFDELIDEVRPFPGATSLLQALAAAGLVVVLASSAPAEHVESSRRLLDADDAIMATTSADDASAAKPAPDIFEVARRAGDIDRGCALVVGDSVWDVQAARRAGMACVGVETGGFSRHELIEEGALYVYRDVLELADQWRTGPLGQLVGCSERSAPQDAV